MSWQRIRRGDPHGGLQAGHIYGPDLAGISLLSIFPAARLPKDVPEELSAEAIVGK